MKSRRFTLTGSTYAYERQEMLPKDASRDTCPV